MMVTSTLFYFMVFLSFFCAKRWFLLSFKKKVEILQKQQQKIVPSHTFQFRVVFSCFLARVHILRLQFMFDSLQYKYYACLKELKQEVISYFYFQLICERYWLIIVSSDGNDYNKGSVTKNKKCSRRLWQRTCSN